MTQACLVLLSLLAACTITAVTVSLVNINLYRKRLARFIEMTHDNPECYCPNCDVYLGRFYNNRIRMVRK
jgi:hypothetical protein